MSITGKYWSAILFTRPTAERGAAFYPYEIDRVLLYTGGQQTLDDIAAYYPDLTWDVASETTRTQMHNYFLVQYVPGPPYDDGEATMLDLQNYLENGNGFYYPEGVTRVEWKDGGWAIGNDPTVSTWGAVGTPSSVAAKYPNANSYNVTSPTPFGDFGNGLITHQAIYHYASGFGNAGGDNAPIPGAYPDTPPISGLQGYKIEMSVVDRTFIFTPEYDAGGPPGSPETPPDGGGDGITDNDVTLRCWTYSLDGHDYYVLRLGAGETLVYDLTTGSWSEWRSPGRTNWRAHVGCNWVGMSSATLDRGWGSDVVAGDDSTGVLWVLDPVYGRDDRTTTGSDNITRVVIGGIQMTSRDVVPCNAVQMDLALGAPSQAFATITLETSDDFGHTWDDQGSVTTNAFDYRQIVEWRSLGQISNPGRIFRFTDNGATVRVSGADMR